jgi:Flp pilus assembly protein TadB
MAQPKNKRRRKRRGTQGGRIDTGSRRSRPQSRQEARQRASSNRGRTATKKKDLPPTWKSAALRGLAAAVIFVLILLVLFKRPVGVSLAFGAFMLVFYIPTGYYIDLTMWRKRERQRIRDREGTP